MKKTALILTLCMTIPTLQSKGLQLSHLHNPDTTAQEFCSTTLKTIAACLCINGLASFATKETYIPTIALLPTAACIGAGKALLWHLDKRALKKEPMRQKTIYSSPFFKGLAITAGLTPILFSESLANEHLRTILSLACKVAWQLGESALLVALTGRSTILAAKRDIDFLVKNK